MYISFPSFDFEMYKINFTSILVKVKKNQHFCVNRSLIYEQNHLLYSNYKNKSNKSFYDFLNTSAPDQRTEGTVQVPEGTQD